MSNYLVIDNLEVSITGQFIEYIFHTQNLASLSRITLIPKYGTSLNKAIIEVDEWYNTTSSANFQARIVNPNREARIMYDDPCYWVVQETDLGEYFCYNLEYSNSTYIIDNTEWIVSHKMFDLDMSVFDNNKDINNDMMFGLLSMC